MKQTTFTVDGTRKGYMLHMADGTTHLVYIDCHIYDIDNEDSVFVRSSKQRLIDRINFGSIFGGINYKYVVSYEEISSVVIELEFTKVTKRFLYFFKDVSFEWED